MSVPFSRENAFLLPLPLAQLYSRANNARDALGRVANSFMVFEVLVKLGASVAALAYLEEVDRSKSLEPKIGELAVQLQDPSLHDWLEFFKATTKFFGQRPDAVSHPLGHVWSQLNERENGRASLAPLREHLWKQLDKTPPEKGCSLLELLDAVVDHLELPAGGLTIRDAPQMDDTIETLVLDAVNEIMAQGAFEPIGRPGTQLVYISDVRSLASDEVELDLRELVGLHGERVAPLTLHRGRAAHLAPRRIAVIWPGRAVPLELGPLLSYRESDLSTEVLFLRRWVQDRSVEYQSYLSGDLPQDDSMEAEAAGFFSRFTSLEAAQDPRQTVTDFTPVMPERSALLPHQIRLKLLEPSEDGTLVHWLFTTRDTIQIGREKDSNARVDNPRVSRRHATISFDGQQWRYANSGTNGTFRNGEKVEQFTINDGDVIQLAATGPRLQFELP